MNTTRILLADDHSLMRMGLAFLINGQKDRTVVGEAANGEEAELPRLTDRQQEILASATRGLSNQEIALQFGISVIAVTPTN